MFQLLPLLNLPPPFSWKGAALSKSFFLLSGSQAVAGACLDLGPVQPPSGEPGWVSLIQ